MIHESRRSMVVSSGRKQASDLMQRVNLSGNDITVVDVYDTSLLGDPSGAKAIVSAKRAIGMLEDISPITSGTAIRGSRQKVLR